MKAAEYWNGRYWVIEVPQKGEVIAKDYAKAGDHAKRLRENQVNYLQGRTVPRR